SCIPRIAHQMRRGCGHGCRQTEGTTLWLPIAALGYSLALRHGLGLRFCLRSMELTNSKTMLDSVRNRSMVNTYLLTRRSIDDQIRRLKNMFVISERSRVYHSSDDQRMTNLQSNP